MKELKEKIRNCDLNQFKDYNDYINYVKKLVLDYLKENNDLTTDDIFNLLEKVKWLLKKKKNHLGQFTKVN